MNVFNKIGVVFSKAWNAVIKSRGPHVSAYERYLNESTDVHDLEARERAWAHKVQHHRMY